MLYSAPELGESLEPPTQKKKMDMEDLGLDGKIHLRIIFTKYVGCFVLNARGSEKDQWRNL
jgi:hypothetical protein